MDELYDEFFYMLYLAKTLHDSAFSQKFLKKAGHLSLDSDACYELAYIAMTLLFAFIYEDYNEEYEFDIWVFGDPCIDKFCRLCQEYEDRHGLSERENPYRQELEGILRECLQFPSYDYGFDWRLSREDRGRKRLLLFTGMEFYSLPAVPVGLLEIRDGFDALNLRLEKELSGGTVIELPVLNIGTEKEAA